MKIDSITLSLDESNQNPRCLDISGLFFFNFTYLFIDREREREAGTKTEGEAGSMQGA